MLILFWLSGLRRALRKLLIDQQADDAFTRIALPGLIGGIVRCLFRLLGQPRESRFLHTFIHICLFGSGAFHAPGPLCSWLADEPTGDTLNLKVSKCAQTIKYIQTYCTLEPGLR